MYYKNYADITDFSSGLRSIIMQLGDFDADLEAMYGMGLNETVENCWKLSGKYEAVRKFSIACLKN